MPKKRIEQPGDVPLLNAFGERIMPSAVGSSVRDMGFQSRQMLYKLTAGGVELDEPSLAASVFAHWTKTEQFLSLLGVGEFVSLTDEDQATHKDADITGDTVVLPGLPLKSYQAPGGADTEILPVVLTDDVTS